MSDTTENSFISEASLKRLKKRHGAERRFKIAGLMAIGVAIVALAVLLLAIGSLALSAYSKHFVTFDLQLDPAVVAPNGTADTASIAQNVNGFYSLVTKDLQATFPEALEDRQTRRELNALVTRLAVLSMAKSTADNTVRIGQTHTYRAALSDDLDLYLKGRVSAEERVRVGAATELQASGESTVTLTGDYEGLSRRITASADAEDNRSVLLTAGATTARIMSIGADSVTLDVMAGDPAAFTQSGAVARIIALPEAQRNVSDRQIAWTLHLKEQGRIERRLNTALITEADSTYPELAGTLAAIVGSLFTMLVTAMIAIPVGIFAAVYLEEFAAKNRITEIIEVNINNLAAVPSIVFGLLGAAVFLNFFGLPRSAPLVGGLVLALLTLPTIIIASRASLKSVPQSIRDAALGVGASKTQSVFHHVIPLAGPGMMTGSIIGMARALGETAPLLLIGMVAFVAEVPSGPTDESTVLPVLIFKWSTGAERAWEPMTAAAIIILLIFMVLMNAFAVFLRRRFERRW